MPTPEHTQTDQELVGRIQDGNRAAFKTLFHRYAEALSAFAEQYTNSPEIAEELVQDLFLKIWRDRANWSPSTSVKSYLYTAIRNQALDCLKHEQIVEEGEALISNRSSVQGPADRLCHEELREAVQEAIQELPKRRRHVFKLSRQHGLTYKEIATVLDISKKTVETHMQRAFKSLREGLDSYSSQYSSLS